VNCLRHAALGLVLAVLSAFTLQAQLPTINTPPVDTSSCQGQPVSLTVTATGASWYLWYQGTTLVDSGAAESTFTIPAVEPVNVGAYRVVVTNLTGAVTSAPVQLTLTDIVVTGPPGGTVASCPGNDVTLSVTVNDLSLATFVQWNDPGGNAVQIAFAPPILPSDLMLTVAGAQASGTYTVEVDGQACIVYTPITLTVASSPAVATVTPARQTACIGTPATFTTASVADGYNWFFINTNTLTTNLLASQATPAFTIPNVQAANIGFYAVQLTNCGGANALSAPAYLGSNVPPALVVQGHWRLGEGGTNGNLRRPIDSSLNYRDFNVDVNGGTTTIVTNGIPSMPPIAFSSSYYVLSNSGYSLSTNTLPVDNYGIEVWAQSWNLSATNINRLVFGGYTNSGLAIVFDGINGFKGVLPFVTNLTATNIVVGAGYVPAATNQWVHLALVRNNGVTTFYVNGQPSGASVTDVPKSSLGLSLGYSPSYSSNLYFYGAADECRLFTFAAGAFNPKELLYNATPPALCMTPNWLTSVIETNWAATGIATASSVYSGTASPQRAIDGNTDGTLNDNSVFHSGGSPDVTPWWQVDLQSVKPIGRVKIYWRTDCCPERNTNFVMTIYDGNSNIVFLSPNATYIATSNAMAFDFAAGTMSGRYVKLQAFNSSTYLMLGEVKVLAPFVDTSIVVTQQPPAITATVMDTTPVTVGPVGGYVLPAMAQPQLNYQWLSNGVPIPYANTNLYVVPQAYNGDKYSVVLSLSGVAVTSAVQVVSGIPVAPIIRFQPADNYNIILASTRSATFSVTAIGTYPLSYQWYSNGVAVAGATGSSYTVTNLDALSAGNFSVVVSNAIGTATSQMAVLSTSPNVAVGFDFNTPGQLTNNFGFRNGNKGQLATWFERWDSPALNPTNGVGNVPGVLDGWFNTTANYNTVTYLNDAFPYPTNDGSTLNISIMFKGKLCAAANAGLQMQVGFVDAGTNLAAFGTNSYIEGGSPVNWLNMRTWLPGAFTNLSLQGGLYMTYNVNMANNVGTGSYVYQSSNTPTNLFLVYSNVGPNIANPYTNWYQLSATFTRTNITNAIITGKLDDYGVWGTNFSSNMLTFNTVTITNPMLPGMGTRCYAAFQGVENWGVDLVDNFKAWITSGAPQITMPVASQTVTAYRAAKLRVKVDGTPFFTFQWKKSTDGGVTWVNIPNTIITNTVWGTNIVYATNNSATYTTPLLTTAGSTMYKVAITNAFGGVESAPATITVVADTVAPSVVSVGSVDGLTVGVLFNEALDPVSAANSGNYTVSTGNPVVGAALQPDGQTVKLTLGTVASGTFTVHVSGVKDLAGNAASLTSPQGKVLGLIYVGDIGAPLTVGSSLSSAPGAIDMTAGGNDFWTFADSGQIALAPRTGDFDIKVRIASVNRGRQLNVILGGEDYTKACLMARASLYEGSTFIGAETEPPDSGMMAGRNQLEFPSRTAYNVTAANIPATLAEPVMGGWMPNLWLRLKRVNNTFTWYYATNQIPTDSYQAGFPYYNPTNAETTPWILYGNSTQPIFTTNTTMLCGVGLTAHFDWINWPASCQFRNFGDFQGYPGISLTIVSNLMNNSATTTTNIVLPDSGYTQVSFPLAVVAAVGNAPSNEVQFLWQKGNFAGGFTNLPSQSAYPTAFVYAGMPTSASNAVSSWTLTTYLGPLDNGTQYRAIVKAPGALSVTSAVFAINITAPAVTNILQAWKAYIPVMGSNVIDLTFNEAINPLSVTNPGNYTVVNSKGQTIAVTSALLQQVATNGVPARVILTMASLLTNGVNYNVTLNNLQAANGTMLAGNSQVNWPYGGRVKVDLFWNISGSANEVITNLTSSFKYITNTPDMSFFSNSFSYGANATGFNDTFNNYGGRLSGYFVPPSNGVYRFYIRNDDPAQLWMCLTNFDPGPFVCSTATNITVTNLTVAPYWTNVFMGTNCPVYTLVTNSLVTNAVMTGNKTLLCYQWTANANYGATLTTLTNGGLTYITNVVSAGTTNINCMYAVGGNMSTNITLVAGQPYYMEGIWKENSGGDGFAMTYRWFATMADALATNIVPPTAEVASDDNFLLTWMGPPVLADTTKPVKIDLFTGLSTTDVTITPGLTGSAAWIANTPNQTMYTNVFGFSWQLSTAFAFPNQGWGDGYGLRAYCNFIPPSNGWYRFFGVSDDTFQLYMNTNSYNGWDPSNKVLLASIAAWRGTWSSTDGTMSTNIYMTAGQPHYMELWFKEGAGGDGFDVNFVYFADYASSVALPIPTPPNFSILTNTYLAPAYVRWTMSNTWPILVEIYTNVVNLSSLVSELNYSPKFQAGIPDSMWYQSYFGWNRDLSDTASVAPGGYPGNAYGARISAYFVPPSNGLYRFWIRSDDQSYLYMNTSGTTGTDVAGKALIVNNGGYTATWTGSGTSYNLTNGVKYYTEMLFREGSGGDGVGMTFTATNAGGAAAPIAPANGYSNDIATAAFFLPIVGPPTVTTISVNIGTTVVTNGTSVTLTASGITGMNPLSYQWSKNGAPIFGATSNVYTTPILTTADNLAVYLLTVNNSMGSAARSVQLYVINDVSPPELIQAVGNGLENEVTLLFNKQLDPLTATNALNYAISDAAGNTIPVLGAWLRADSQSVALKTGPQVIGTRYTAYVFNVADATTNHNPVLPFTKAQFTSWNYQHGLVTVDFFTGLDQAGIASSVLGEYNVMNNAPNDTRYNTFFGYTTYGVNYYAGRAYAWFIAPSNGLYRFYIAVDDEGLLYMNTNAVNSMDPAGKSLIAAYTYAANGNYADLTHGQTISPYISLVGGQWYYMEGDWKNVTGGDFFRVAFREKQVEDQAPTQPSLQVSGNAETIPGAFFVSLGNPDAIKLFMFTMQPTNQTVQLGQLVAMSIAVTSAPNQTIAYQWQKYDSSSSTWKDMIYSAANTTVASALLVEIPPVAGTYQYRAYASCPGLTITSAVATATVNYVPEATPTPPSLVGAWGNPTNRNQVTAFFSEAVTNASAITKANYLVTNSLGAVYGISNAVQITPKMVLLTLSNQFVAGITNSYFLVANGVKDVDDNLPCVNSRVKFNVADGAMPYVVYVPGQNIPPVPFDTTAYGVATNNTLTNVLWYSMQTSGAPYNYGVKPDGMSNYYFCLIKGYFIPPSNGVYRFYEASDDSSYFFMNTNAVNSTDPNGKVQLVFVSAANLTYANPTVVSGGIPLNAGQAYYMETLMGQGTGGEYVRVNFREYNDITIPADTTAMSSNYFSYYYSVVIPTPATLAAASGDARYYTNVTVYFSKAMDAVSALNTANYSLSDSAGNIYPIASAAFFDATKSNAVLLSLASPAMLTGGNGTNYTVTASNILDLQFGLSVGGWYNFYVADGSMAADIYENDSAHSGIFPTYVPLTQPTETGFISNYLFCGTYPVSTWPVLLPPNINIPGLVANRDNYAGRVYGYIIPPSNGVYKFFIASDDGGDLWMNTNNLNSTDPSGIVYLVGNTVYTDSYGSAGCPWITLNAGQRYYFEGRWHDGTGEDWIQVGIQEQKGTLTFVNYLPPPPSTPDTSSIVPGFMMSSPYTLTIANMGQMTYLDSLSDVILTPAVGGPVWGAQWYMSNAVAGVWAPIAGQNALTLSLAGAVSAYSGNTYALIVTRGSLVASNAALFNVLVDTNKPMLVGSAGDLVNMANLTVSFSKCVNTTDASDPTRYKVTGSDGSTLGVTAAVMQGCSNVVLTVAPSRSLSVTYTVTASDIRDLAVTPNVLVSGSAIVQQSGFTPGFLNVDVYYNEAASSGTLAGLYVFTNSARYKANQPDYRTTIGSSDWHYVGYLPAAPTGLGLNYKAKIWGWFIPPQTATYQFYTRADDQTLLTMNLNGADTSRTSLSLVASNNGATQMYGQSGTGNWNANSVLLNAGQPYYIEVLWAQGTGQEYWQMCYSVNGIAPYSPGSVIPGISGQMPGAQVIGGSQFGVYGAGSIATNPTITFFQQPVGTNVPAGTPVSFTALANLSGGSTVLTNLFYQWQCSPDGVTWTNWYPPLIFNAANAMLGNMSTNFIAQFYYDTYVRCFAEIPGGYGVASRSVLVSITDYNAVLGSPFFIQSVGTLDGYTVRVVFNRPVDTTYGTATDPGVYTFNNGMVGVLGTPTLLADGRTILLTVDTSPGGNNGPLVGPFSVETWGGPVYDSTGTMGDYEQFFGSSFGATFINNIGNNPGMTNGDPFLLGSAWSDMAGGVDMNAGGSDFWNAGDGGYYVAKQVTGNFDIKVRVAAITNDYYKGFTDPWEKAAILARVSTNYNSRMVAWASGPPYLPQTATAAVSPNNVDTGYGQNLYTVGVREVDGSGIGYNVSGNVAWQTNITPWLRLTRVGSVFYAFRSIDGVNWLLQGAKDTAGTFAGAFPDTIWLGLGATAHFNSNGIPVPVGMAKVKFRDLYMPLPATITVQPSPASTILDWTNPPITLSFTVVANNPPNAGNLSYQWRKNNVVIMGANTPTLTLNNVQPLAAAGSYDVIVANDGGGQASTPCVIMVTNAPPITSAEAFTTVQNMAETYPGSTVLLPNDIDPEGAGLTAIRVSGIYPTTFFADFENGLPPGVAIYGNAYATNGSGFTNGGCVHLTDAVGNQTGSLVISNLAPGRRVASFSASFKMRIGDNSANGADGFCFAFAPDLPDASGLIYPGGVGAEEGFGSGLCINFDNYDNGNNEAPALEVKYGGVIISRVPIYKVNNPNYMDFKVDLWPNGTVDVYLTNTLVMSKIQTPYVPMGGRFGFYARTGGQYETHWLDNVSITAYTIESSVAGSVNYAADFNSGTFANAASYGTATVATNGADVFMQLNPATNNQAGSFIINELTPGAPVAYFMASFKVRMGDGSAEPADGLSFNFAPDLTNAASVSTGNEEGVGTGLSVCFDNYRAVNNTAGTAAFKVKYYGVQFAVQQVPVQNSPNWLQVNVYLKPNGRLDLLVNGSYIFQNIATPYVPKTGRFGFYARTGGAYETHWLDDVNITAYTYGTAVLTNQSVVYTPPTNGCGNDSFYYVVSDPQGGTTLDMATVQVTPANPQPPVIVSCATNMTTFSLAGMCQGAIPDMSIYSGLVVTDNCCCVNITQIPAAGTLVMPGIYAVQIIATGGASGLSSYCTNFVTVLDNHPPVFAGCPAAQAFSTDPGQCTAAVSWANPTANDPCDGAVPVTCVPPSGTTFPRGTTTVVCSATDSRGNVGTCSFTVTVSDTTPPQITCANMVVGTSATTCDQVVTYSPTITENCTVTNLACVPPSGSTFVVGTASVTCTATDSSGNIGTCTFTVTVNDTTLPAFVCPGNMIIPVDAGTNGAVVNYATPVGTDNCPGVGATMQVAGLASGSFFPEGRTTNTFTATDAAGNVGRCSFVVYVGAGEFPVVTCPSNIVAAANAGQCGKSNVTWTVNATGTNCLVTSLICTPASGSTFAVGATTVTCWATNDCGNFASCSFTVTINDTEKPVITCPANVEVAADAGQCGKAVSFAATATDNCAVSGIVCVPASGSTFTVGSHTVTCTATDVNANTAQCSFTVKVDDTEKPVITCLANIIAGNTPGQCGKAVTYVAPTATDNCAGATVACLPASGSTFAVGVHTVTCTATDASGNSATCNFTVTINDSENPVITCPTAIVASADAGQCGKANVTFAPTATDNCGVAGVVCVPASGSTFVVGTTTVTCTATDTAGNSSQCNFTVKINDTQNPVVTCPGNITASADAGICSKANVTWTAPTATDNCAVTNITCAPASGSTFVVGTTTVTCTAKDASGNIGTCSFTVTINDTEKPVITSYPTFGVTGTADTGHCSKSNVLWLVSATDNCGVKSTVCVPANGSTFTVGVHSVTCTVSDNANNTATCQFTVTVTDTEKPVITTCAPAQTLTAGSGGTVALPDLTALTVATDNCGTPVLSQVPAVGALLPVGSTNVVITATDAAGNTATCTVAVVVQAGSKPVLAITQLDTGEVKVYWTAPATGWNLYSAPAVLGAGTVWTPVSASLYVTNGGYIYILVTNPGSKPDKFYHLKNP